MSDTSVMTDNSHSTWSISILDIMLSGEIEILYAHPVLGIHVPVRSIGVTMVTSSL